MNNNILFEAYEDNGGNIVLFILNNYGRAVAGFGHFEYERGSLKEAIEHIGDYLQFGNQFGFEIDMPMHYERDEDGYDVPVRELTIGELYTSWVNGWYTHHNRCIAWNTGSGLEFINPKHMGYAALLALDIKEADDD